MNTQLPYWLAAMYLRNVAPSLFLQWLAQFPSIEAMSLVSRDELFNLGMRDQQIKAWQHPDWKAIEADIQWANLPGQHIVTFADPDYPKLLAAIPDPPLVLFIRGEKSVLTHPQLAIVGSRHASVSGLQNAYRFAGELVASGLAVTSGLAQGIDSASHRGALMAQGITLAVTGTGLNHCYPRGNQRLMDDILAHRGAVISEFPLNTRPHAFNFPRRNRIISGLSVGVLVVEAALKSGSLITVRHALEQGREVFAIPGSILQPLSQGCHKLIRQGAKLVESVPDILEELGSLRAVLASQSPLAVTRQPELSPQQSTVFEQIESESTPIDTIIQRSGLTSGEVSSILLVLELAGYIQSVTGGYVRLLPN